MLNLRHKWKIASHALMCERKAFPNPWPSAAPFTRPAMSTTLRKAGTLLQRKKKRKENWWSSMFQIDPINIANYPSIDNRKKWRFIAHKKHEITKRRLTTCNLQSRTAAAKSEPRSFSSLEDFPLLKEIASLICISAFCRVITIMINKWPAL